MLVQHTDHRQVSVVYNYIIYIYKIAAIRQEPITRSSGQLILQFCRRFFLGLEKIAQWETPIRSLVIHTRLGQVPNSFVVLSHGLPNGLPLKRRREEMCGA